ncbi:GGDEF domain-containing protein, partial [Leptolyngbya sp. FACHB-36]|uniref:diguanylate cyclase n=1 Tax=Leptolyngbya sp. FACHB-36 TaxID=2692808 RepID=UPI001680FB7E
ERLVVEDALRAANQELQRLAYMDGLTQVANRRYFDERLEYEWRRLLREHHPLSLILCDVDFFKQYNDTYGHQIGDDCLRFIASAIRSVAKRATDLVVRYGGEEFAVILSNTPLEGAVQVAQKIRTAVRQLQLPHQHSSVSPYVTLSLGVACIVPTPGTSAVQLIAAADRSLYQAKAAGRDRIMTATQLQE